MLIHEINNRIKGFKTRKRVGRGPGSGLGKTSGRGQKGQKSRKGYSAKRGFEGGQFPLYRRIPKRGFTSVNKIQYGLVNVFQLNQFEDGEVINRDVLLKAGIIRKKDKVVKLLGHGDLNKNIEIHVQKASVSAIEKIEAAKGKVIIEKSI